MRVLHLVGSAVSDFYADLSRLYAADCLDAVGDLCETHIAYVSPDGSWRFPASLADTAIAVAPAVSVAGAVERIVGLGADVMVPQMFCVPGMTHYRALFDVLGIPYVGNPPDVMALTADKVLAKAVVAAAGVRVPAGSVVRRGERPAVDPPAVVKPVDADNSLGVTLVRHAENFDAALEVAFIHADAALVEAYVPLGREVRCGIVVRDGELVPLPLEEYRVEDVRRHADKIREDDGSLGLVAKVQTEAWIVDPADPITFAVHAAARTCHTALGCRDYSLFDFRIDPDGTPFFLEASLYCSFARQSVLSVMAAAAGIPLPDLFESSIAAASQR